MKDKKELIGKSLLYIVVAFVANYLSSLLVMKCMSRLVAFLIRRFDMTAATINVVTMLFVTVLDLLIVVGIMLLFIRAVLPPLYEASGDKLWLKKSALLVLPGEAVRFAVTLTDLGFVDGSGRLATVPACLFQLVYLKDPGKSYDIRQLGRFDFSDYMAFSLCYVLYLAVFLAAVFLLCRIVWNKYGKDYEDL